MYILVPRGRAPFGQHQESRPLARSNDIPGRVPFNQDFRKLRFKIEWNRNFPEIRFENFGSPLGSDPHRNLSDQLQSHRHAHVRPHCFFLTDAFSRRLELAYFAGKITKNRPVCKNAVALAYYGSCRLLVIGSCLKSLC